MLPGRDAFINQFTSFYNQYKQAVNDLREQQSKQIPQPVPQTETILFPTRIHSLQDKVASLQHNTLGPLSFHEIIKCADPFLNDLSTALTTIKDSLNLCDFSF